MIEKMGRSSLQGKNVLIIGSNSGPKSMEILRSCRATGATLFVAVSPKHDEIMHKLILEEDDFTQRGIHLLVIPLMTLPIQCSREELAEKVAEMSLEIPKRFNLSESYTGLDGCTTFTDALVDYTAYIQKALDLPGFDPLGVDIACDKLLFRQTLQRAGTFGVIHSCSLSDYLEDRNVSAQLNNTVVLKPTMGSGSSGVFLCSSKQDVIQKYQEYETTHSRTRTWMLDEYVEGIEIGVELIMTQGVCVFSSLMECEKTPPPIFQGLGRFYPSLLSSSQQDKVIQECIHAAQYLHLDHGVIDFDVKYNQDRGPLILEINTRMGGNSVGLMHKAVYGIDLIEQVLLCACQLIDTENVFRPQTPAAYAKMVLAQKPGILHADMNSHKFTDILKETLGGVSTYLTSARCTAVAGAHVTGACEAKNVPTILGVVIAVGESWTEAKDHVDLILSTAIQVLNSHVLPLEDQKGNEHEMRQF